ncbi:MAG: FAD:protein FMN transferase [Oscillospiraceae bacterium]
MEKTGFYLDTVVTVTLYGQEDTGIIDECFALCEKYEKIFSRTDPESELYRLNAADSAVVSDELLTVLTAALRYCELSGGRFDITMGAISDMYGFSGNAPTLPAPEKIEEALAHVGYEKVRIDGSTVTLTDPDTVIDLGAIAKGYIADRLKDFLLEKGVESAIIDLGGNILCVGSKPDGSDFRVGIQYPDRNTNRTITTARLSDLSVVTSGVYQRFFETEDGTVYHHLLDPSTGYSLRNGLVSVSIIAPSSLDCDALSTTCFALGLDEGLALINSMENVWAVFITEDLELHYSQGFEARFCQ